ncbi:MAG: acyltransferase [Aquabacterium sp.]|nr:MAG: acyltransferase [Aquabacterium sp.]
MLPPDAGAHGGPARITPRVSSLLDAARWIAAFLVVISHLRLILFTDYAPGQPDSPFWAAFFFVCGFGREAVVVFFVISGMLVGGLTLDKLRARPQSVSVQRYLIARFSRIYIVLVPVLVLGCLLDQAGRHWLAAPGLYDNPSFDWPFAQIFAGNLLLLQDIAVPAVGTNGPLWSLAYEWWYYMAFALALLAVQAPRYELRMMWLLAFGLLCVVLPQNIVIAGGLWVMGVVAVLAVRHARPTRLPLLVPLAALAVLLVALRVLMIKQDFGFASLALGWFKQGLLGAAFCWLVLTAWRAPVAAQSAPPRWAALNLRLAAFSYSLYLTHVPVMDFAVGVLQRLGGRTLVHQPQGWVQFGWFLALLAIVYAVAWLFGQLTEERTAQLRSWLERRTARASGLAANDADRAA